MVRVYILTDPPVGTTLKNVDMLVGVVARLAITQSRCQFIDRRVWAH